MKNNEAVLHLKLSRGLVVWAALVLALVLGIAAASTVFAQDDQTINGCANKKNGALRVLKAGSACTSKETAISWNQAGPKGDPGEQGPPGPDGGDAGTLDGKDSTEFLGARQKAVDANLLDGKDSAEFAPDTNQDGKADAAESADQATNAANADSATDADKLDGKDSADFAATDHGHTTVVRTATRTVPSQGFVYEFAKTCQPGERATGGGGGFRWRGEPTFTVLGNNQVRANGEVLHSYPLGGPIPNLNVPLGDGGIPRAWAIDVYNEADFSRTVEVYVICTSGVRQPSGIPGGD